MRLKKLPSEFQEALPILEKIRRAGYEAYFVGGSVRDAILGRPSPMSISLPPLIQKRPRLFSSGPLMSGLNTGRSWFLKIIKNMRSRPFEQRMSMSTFEDQVRLILSVP